jgi:hypothetical protein
MNICFTIPDFSFKIFTDFWQVVDKFLFENVSIESLIASPVLIIGFLLPVAVLLIDSKNKILPWDHAVILTTVLKIKSMFVGLVVFILVPLLWHGLHIRPLLLMILIAYLVFYLLMIIESYKWLIVTEESNSGKSNFRIIKRENFLSSLNDSQKAVIWSKTFSLNRNIKGFMDERNLIKIFIKNLESMTSPDANLLRNFISNLSNTNLFDPIIHEDLINFCLVNGTIISEKDDNDNIDRFEFINTVNDLYFEIMEEDLKNDFGIYMFFAHTRKFSKANNAGEVFLIRNIAARFLSSLDKSKDIHKIFNGFPNDWQITFERIENETTQGTALNWLDSYMHWVVDKNLLTYNEKDGNYDSVADDVTRELLPKIDMFTWTDLIIFQWSSFGQDENETVEHARIRNFLNGRKKFGLIGRFHGFWGENEKKLAALDHDIREREIKETLNIATKTTIFPILLNPTALNKYIKELKYYKEKDKAKKEKLEMLQKLFNEIKKHQSKK